MAETLRNVETHDPMPPRTARPEVARDIEAICLKCRRRSRIGAMNRPGTWPTTSAATSTARRSEYRVPPGSSGPDAGADDARPSPLGVRW